MKTRTAMLNALICGLVFGVGTDEIAINSAEACGVKRVTVARRRPTSLKSKNPSSILVVGRRDSGLVKALRSANHSVTYASQVSNSANSKYKLVLADSESFSDAQSAYPNSKVVRRKTGTRKTVAKVENLLTRRVIARNVAPNPIDRSEERTPIRSKTIGKAPIRTGLGDSAIAPTPLAKEVQTPVQTRIDQASKKPDSADTGKPKEVETSDPKVAKVTLKPKIPTKKIEAKKERPRSTSAVDSKAPAWTKTLRFGLNRDSIKSSGLRRLKRNAAWLMADSSRSCIIEGHTDTVGDEAYNQELSERRGQHVKGLLIQFGVDPSQLKVVGMGETEPAVSPGLSPANRRVVLRRE